MEPCFLQIYLSLLSAGSRGGHQQQVGKEVERSGETVNPYRPVTEKFLSCYKAFPFQTILIKTIMLVPQVWIACMAHLTTLLWGDWNNKWLIDDFTKKLRGQLQILDICTLFSKCVMNKIFILSYFFFSWLALILFLKFVHWKISKITFKDTTWRLSVATPEVETI